MTSLAGVTGAEPSPSKSETVGSEDDLRRAVDAVRSAPNASLLAAFASDVLFRQAEGKLLFAGREFVEGRAKEHGVVREGADTPLGNLMTIVERGPESTRERTLLAAFAVTGFEKSLGTLPSEQGGDRTEALKRFIRHADWLESNTPFVVYPLAEALLPPPLVRELYSLLGKLVAADTGFTSADRARQAGRLSALAAVRDPSGSEALAFVADGGTDPVVRSFARSLMGRSVTEATSARLTGHVGRPVRSGWSRVWRWCTGFALLEWAARFSWFVMRGRSDVDVALVEGGFTVKRRHLLLGRVLRESQETYTTATLVGAGREVRVPGAPLLVGALSLSIGFLVGGVFLFDGLRSGDSRLLAVGAAFLALGAGLDFVVDTWLPARKGAVTVHLHFPKRSVHVTGVAIGDADRFLTSLRNRFKD